MPGKSGDEKVVVKAQAVGKAAGKAAAVAGAVPQTKSGGEPASTSLAPARRRGVAEGKLQKKGNPHLPRRLKKAEMKRAQNESRPAV